MWPQGVTVERVEGFARPDGRQGLLVVELVIEVHGRHLHLALLTLLLRVTAIRAAQESKTRSNYSNRPREDTGPPHQSEALGTKTGSNLPVSRVASETSPWENQGSAVTDTLVSDTCLTLISRPQNREAKAAPHPYCTSPGPARSC